MSTHAAHRRGMGTTRRSAGRTARGGVHRGVGRLRAAAVTTAGVLLIVGASTVGLHDWADAQLDGVAAHGPSV